MIDPDTDIDTVETNEYNTLSDVEWRNVEDVVFSVLEDCAKKIPICQHAEITDTMSYDIIHGRISDFVNGPLRNNICDTRVALVSNEVADVVIDTPAIAVLFEHFNRRISKLEDIAESICGLEKLSTDNHYDIDHSDVHYTSFHEYSPHSVTYYTDDFKEQYSVSVFGDVLIPF